MEFMLNIVQPKILHASNINIDKYANSLFPNSKRITEEQFSDYYNAFLCMDSKFIKNNLSVINESVWTFNFHHTFFCIILDPGLSTEKTCFGMIEQ
jgi:hypothetical protein